MLVLMHLVHAVVLVQVKQLAEHFTHNATLLSKYPSLQTQLFPVFSLKLSASHTVQLKFSVHSAQV